jgi:hypothetical protein
MSVVKKLQAGGTAGGTLEDYILNEFSKNKFTSEGEKTAREVASNWLNFSKSKDFQKALKFDKVKGVYSIDPSQINDDSLKSIDWTGSEGKAQKNLFGQYSGSDKKNYNISFIM